MLSLHDSHELILKKMILYAINAYYIVKIVDN